MLFVTLLLDVAWWGCLPKTAVREHSAQMVGRSLRDRRMLSNGLAGERVGKEFIF